MYAHPAMKKLIRVIVSIAAFSFAWGVWGAPQARAADGVAAAQSFQTHIDYLADDKLEGRGVGSKGIELAADYIAEHFKTAGLEPAGDDHTYFQTFQIGLSRKLTDANRLTVGRGEPLVQGQDFIPLSFSSSGTFQGKVAFCGFGIVNPNRAHDDFAGIDLKGAVALILDGEPTQWADQQGNPSPYAFRRDKVYNAKDNGAAAVLFVGPRPDPGQPEELTPFEGENADEYGIPAMHITREVARRICNEAGAGELDDLQKLLEAGHVTSALFKRPEVSGEVRFEKSTAPTRNVLGLLRGEGSLADEFVVIGAHYDHLGIRRPMMRRFKEGKLVQEKVEPQIHNGADDNASGVAGLIEIAKLFAAGPKPKRTVVFIAFTAEETGLQGSKYYVEHPAAPLDQTVTMINMDMIGRLPQGARKVSVFGARSAKEFMEILETAGKAAGLGFVPGVDSGGRSDHAVFVRRGIPSMHFYSGNHSDYHKPTDDANLINAEAGAKVAKAVYETTMVLATRDGRPTPQIEPREDRSADPHAAIAGQDPDKLPTFKVVMGLSPDYSEGDQPGMGVDAVSPEGPADKAGMKAGDRIIRIGGKAIANIYDYMAATRNNNPGDTVEVVVLREGKEQVLKVTLASAR